jgi:C4-type Zn-finger protein
VCWQAVKNDFLAAKNSVAMELKFECPACGQHLSATRYEVGVFNGALSQPEIRAVTGQNSEGMD